MSFLVGLMISFMGIGLGALPAEANPSPVPNAETPSRGEWGDQGNGTYTNPIVPGDFSDVDCIRVGKYYYAISSTFQSSPGEVILRSQDLVNWKIIGHAVRDITEISPAMNWTEMNRYGRGIWAGSIRYHDGLFWIYFTTPNEGIFMTTAKNPAGPWAPLTCVWRVSGWDDPCPFWDTDGQGYLVTSNFAGGYKIHLFKLSADGKSLDQASDTVIHQSHGSEANKFYKINGYYYHYYSEVHPEGRVPMMERSKSLAGPWQIQQLMHVSKAVDKEPNQGGFVQVPDGRWYFVTHQGTGQWDGRPLCLLPVTWIKGFPIIGRVGPDGIGNMIWRGRKPLLGYPLSTVTFSDSFKGKTLQAGWEWNCQPRTDKWSLTAHPGWLRLEAFPPLEPGNFLKAGNTLAQRSLATHHNQVTVKIKIAGLTSGQQSGLVHFSQSWCTFGVLQNGDVRRITFTQNGHTITGPVVTQKVLWLRSEWGPDGLSQFSYSLDGKDFTPFGPPYQLKWGFYRGDRIGMYTFNDLSTSGYADFTNFRYIISRAKDQ